MAMDTGTAPDLLSMKIERNGLTEGLVGLAWQGTRTLELAILGNPPVTTFTITFTDIGQGPQNLAGVEILPGGPFDINFPLPPVE